MSILFRHLLQLSTGKIFKTQLPKIKKLKEFYEKSEHTK